MLSRLSICLLLFTTVLYAVDDSTTSGYLDNNLSFFCPSSDTIFVDCLPIVPDFLRDDISTGDEDRIWFDNFDFSSSINSSCNTVVVQIDPRFDITSNPAPQDCSDFRVVTRRIDIYDGNPSDPNVFPESCTITYKVKIPFNLTLIRTFNDPFIVKCSDDIALEYQNFVDNFGFNDIEFGCTPFIENLNDPTYSPVPSVDAIAYTCGSTAFPGNGSIRPGFFLIDSCGNDISTARSFVVVDDEPPVFDICPAAFSISIGAGMTSIMDSIDIHLNLASANDNCSAVAMITNDFDIANVDFGACVNQSFTVTSTAVDDCGNSTLPSACITQITINSSADISINCPADPLIVECGAIDANGNPIADTEFGNWIATTTANDFTGAIILDISNDFTRTLLESQFCSEDFIVTFTATDVCFRTASCTQMLRIEDTTPPVTTGCPGALTVNAADPTIISDVNAWISTFTATDQCLTSIQPMNDLDQTILAPDCGSAQPVTVLFWADDNCNPIDSSCSPTLTILNDVVADFSSFPSDTTIECSTNPNTAELSLWLNQAQAGNNIGGTFTVMNDLDFFNPELSTCDAMLDVRIFFVDQCGIEVERFATINVIDTQAPEVICPQDITLNADTSQDITVDVTAWLATAVLADNCGLQPVIENYQPQAFGGCDEIITNPITFLAEDECGNFSTSCMAMLTIEATKRPSISCPVNLTMECGDTTNVDRLAVWLDGATATSVLGDTLNEVNDFIAADFDLISCGDEQEVTFSITDNCGFTETCMRTVRVEDTTPPNVTCPPTITVNSTDLDINVAISDWRALVAFDDNGCLGPAMFDDFDDSMLVFCDQSTPLDVIFTVNDQCGLTNSCLGRINFNQTLPQITCPDGSVSFECGDPANFMLINDWLASASAIDNSGLVETTTNDFDFSVIDSTCNQNIPVEFAVIDTCGRENNCLANIIITDSQPPVYINGCPDPLALLSGSPIANKMESFQDWVDGIFIEDCNDYTLDFDFDPTTFTVDCDDIDIDITFTLVDDCGWLANDCNTQINITNNIDATLNCAQHLQ